ncbi:unnamed protein product [Malus baccata var. baccata]
MAIAILLLVFSIPFSESKLTEDYYKQTCPDFQKIVRDTASQKQAAQPTTAAGTLRLFVHDCLVEGCDGSVLIASNHLNKAERDAEINESLAGDGFEVVVRAKTALELTCPGIVSCADILAEATRDLVTMVGGPFYSVRLGRKDGQVSLASKVEGNLPRANQTVDELIKFFAARGFTIEEMVALTGGHTIGFSHCKEFTDRLFHYSKTTPTDPEINPKYAEALKMTCGNYTTNPAMAAFNDVITPGKFDNMYYQNLKRGLGLLASDHALAKDPRTKPFVELYSTDQAEFFKAFSHAMEKLGHHEIKTGHQGEPPMSQSMALPILFLLFLAIPFSESKLSIDYYKKTCPDFESIVRDTVTSKQIASPTTAAGTLRLFFHDCMVEGCDASILISSNYVNTAERDADINQSLSADAFDLVARAKTAIELSCPGIVSCSDILTLATRNLVTMVGGPFYKVRLGRKDGQVSKASLVEGNLPKSNQTLDDMIKFFATKGFTLQEMVALSGAHTIGFAHCKEFVDRIFNYNKTTPTDPDMYPNYAQGLKKICADYKTNIAMSAFNDVITPGKFDNMYYQNLKRGLGLLASDHVLVKDPRTRPFVELYSTDQAAFFKDFAHAMEKLSHHGVKTGRKGEVRHSRTSFGRKSAWSGIAFRESRKEITPPNTCEIFPISYKPWSIFVPDLGASSLRTPLMEAEREAYAVRGTC